MTYCIGIKTKQGIIIASDSRTNAGFDNVNIYSKMFTYDVGDRTIIIVTSGNLGTSQAVYKSIEKDIKTVEEALQQSEAQRVQLQANLFALQGALQQCDFFLIVDIINKQV